ncbi:MAG TPA: hypothetical protein DCF49_06525 [Lachnospiraceae bacterium]|nr:hypothetical protein [Lachnospiraceae bacterium]
MLLRSQKDTPTPGKTDIHCLLMSLPRLCGFAAGGLTVAIQSKRILQLQYPFQYSIKVFMLPRVRRHDF